MSTKIYNGLQLDVADLRDLKVKLSGLREWLRGEIDTLIATRSAFYRVRAIDL